MKIGGDIRGYKPGLVNAVLPVLNDNLKQFIFSQLKIELGFLSRV